MPHGEFVQNRVFLDEYYKNVYTSDKLAPKVKDALKKNYEFERKQVSGIDLSMKEDDTGLDEKERKKLEKKRAEDTKKARKNFPAGNEYTLEIEKQNNSYLETENEADNQVELNAENINFNLTYKFTPKYIARNYIDAKKTLDKIVELAVNSQVNGVNMLLFAEKCKEMMKTALLVHGLKEDETTGTLIAATESECADAEYMNMGISDTLKKMFISDYGKKKLQEDLYRFKMFREKTQEEIKGPSQSNRFRTDAEYLLEKVEVEIKLMETIHKKCYGTDAGEELTHEEWLYAERNNYISDEAKKQKLISHLECMTKAEQEIKDVENNELVEKTRKAIFDLSDKVTFNSRFEDLDKYRYDLYTVLNAIYKTKMDTFVTNVFLKVKLFKIKGLAEKLRSYDLEKAVNTGCVSEAYLVENEKNQINKTNIDSVDIKEFATKQRIVTTKSYKEYLRKISKYSDVNEKITELYENYEPEIDDSEVVNKQNAVEWAKKMYNKYGVELKDIDYIVENYYKIIEDKSMALLYKNISDDKSQWDETDEKDMFLRNLIEYYDGYFEMITYVISRWKDQNPTNSVYEGRGDYGRVFKGYQDKIRAYKGEI